MNHAFFSTYIPENSHLVLAWYLKPSEALGAYKRMSQAVSTLAHTVSEIVCDDCASESEMASTS